MKKLNLAVVLVFMLSAKVFAGYSNNPDKTLSFGVDYTQAQTDLTLAPQQLIDLNDSSTVYRSPSALMTTKQLTLDIRMPVSDSLTVTMHGGSTNINYYGSNSGYSIGAGLRFYVKN